jgi:hypothetical protein
VKSTVELQQGRLKTAPSELSYFNKYVELELASKEDQMTDIQPQFFCHSSFW